ncbi:hypothetical protein RhiJN_24837 [Ceratobasidium sp. AG-Ba]|nr:hypothetical protein RhiJN_24837 [Ceratobasidium sp. AG-Ba]
MPVLQDSGQDSGTLEAILAPALATGMPEFAGILARILASSGCRSLAQHLYNESTTTEADIIHGRLVPRPTVESVADSDNARLSEDMGRTPEHTEPVQATAPTEEAKPPTEPAGVEQAN